MQQVISFSDSTKQLRDKRFFTIFLFGFCSGFPWVLHGSVLTLWLQESGFSRSTIGFIGAIATVYAINWMWAPFIDRLQLPFFYKRFGQRRSWILFCQIGITLAIACLSFTNPDQSLLNVSLLALVVAIFSATLDISVDAYRINIFSEAEMDAKMPFAAAVNIAGYYAGFGFIGGALALALGGETIGLSWPLVYRTLVLLYLVLIILILFTPRPLSETGVSRTECRRQSSTFRERVDTEVYRCAISRIFQSLWI